MHQTGFQPHPTRSRRRTLSVRRRIRLAVGGRATNNICHDERVSTGSSAVSPAKRSLTGRAGNEAVGQVSLDPDEHELALDALAKLLTKRVVERYRERTKHGRARL